MKKIHVLLTITSIVVAVGFGAYVYYQNSIRDEVGPVITAGSSELNISIEDDKKKILEDVEAIDEKDGDVSDSLLVESISMTGSGNCTVVYAAYDKSNNVSKASRKLIYKDYESPRFSISKALRFPVGSYDGILSAVNAVDCMEGDISNKIRIRTSDNSVYMTAGIYDYELEVTNSLGDTATLPISVEYYADSHEERLYRPEIKLTGYLEYLEVGASFNPTDYVDYITRGENLYLIDENSKVKIIPSPDDEEVTSDESALGEIHGKAITGTVSSKAVSVNGKVDTSTPGVYMISYTCKTADGYSGTTQLTVVVQG